MKIRQSLLALASAVLAAAPVSAQSLNINLGTSNLAQLPSNAYGAAANQTGSWNVVSGNPASTTNLIDVNGAPTTVTIAHVGGFGDFGIPNATWSGDDEKLMEKAVDVGGLAQGGGTITWTISGLVAGSYRVYTYALAPDLPATYRTRVAVTNASEASQIVGGAWPGSPHVLGISYALHTVTVGIGQNLTIVTTDPGAPANNLATVNGLQIQRTDSAFIGTPFCFGDGTATACPCGNNSNFGANEGCLNSLGLGGKLQATGVASLSNDSVVLRGSRMPNSFALYFQGTAQQNGGLGAVFGDGLRCASGSIARLATKSNAGGISQYPAAGDASVSVRGNVTGAGTREYQVWYRNPAAFCTASTFNLTNGLQLNWAP